MSWTRAEDKRVKMARPCETDTYPAKQGQHATSVPIKRLQTRICRFCLQLIQFAPERPSGARFCGAGGSRKGSPRHMSP